MIIDAGPGSCTVGGDHGEVGRLRLAFPLRSIPPASGRSEAAIDVDHPLAPRLGPATPRPRRHRPGLEVPCAGSGVAGTGRVLTCPMPGCRAARWMCSPPGEEPPCTWCRRRRRRRTHKDALMAAAVVTTLTVSRCCSPAGALSRRATGTSTMRRRPPTSAGSAAACTGVCSPGGRRDTQRAPRSYIRRNAAWDAAPACSRR